MSNIIPPALVRRLGAFAGFDTAAFQAVHEEEEGVSAIRINPAKPHRTDTSVLQRVPWCDTGFYLPRRPVFTLDPLFHAGCYYVQDASSMFLAHAVKALALDQRPLIALDLCAAPGGKSTLLNTYLHADSLLIANEPIKARATTLADNLVRWGLPNTVVTNNDPSAFSHLPGYVDFMLVDAPCSGSGMFRKDRGTIAEWSEGIVQLCSERQRRILADSLPTLKEGGVLLYATCSYSEEENEQVSDWLCETQGVEPIAIPIDEAWGIEPTHSEKHGCPGYRFYPHKLRGEGFFIAAFRKTRSQATFDRRKLKPGKATFFPELKNWVTTSDQLTSFTVGEDSYVLPEAWEPDLRILQSILYLRNAGTRVGRIAKKAFVPAHDLTMSTLQHLELPKLPLDFDLSLEYLRKGNLPPSVNTKGLSGWALATYNGVPLGWTKLLPNRINNYYPKEWRIVTL
ncbi:RNA methyltransferase [Parapedobacter deserti]|uniref:RNA methyltransferase n=1 Tax=Parapedobacter deserti TaxID=1912957 RepID=A0ABV7JK80_9SPHI